MKLKTLLVVVAVLAVLSAIIYVVQRPAAAVVTDPRVGRSLADRSTVEQMAQFRLSDQGKSVTLIRQTDGSWRVANYFDLPVDFSKLTGFVGSLTGAKLQRLVTTNPARIARLDFKDTKLEILDAQNKVTWSATLGKNAETGGGRFVRFGSEERAYLADFSAWLDAEPKNWADSQILNLKPDDVAKIEIPFAVGGPITVSRLKKSDPWSADKTPAGRRVNAGMISSVLRSVGDVRFSDTVDLTNAGIAAAKANERIFRLTTFAGQTYTVALGRKPEGKKPKAVAPSPSVATAPKPEAAQPEAKEKPVEPKPPTPEFETIPAGPVFVFISSTDPAAPVNALMQKRAFQISDYIFTGLPQKPDELFESIPPAAAKPVGTEAPEPKKN